MLTIEERMNLLAKIFWDWKDIADYFDVGRSTAFKIKSQCRPSPIINSRVSSKEVLKQFNITLKEEKDFILSMLEKLKEVKPIVNLAKAENVYKFQRENVRRY